MDQRQIIEDLQRRLAGAEAANAILRESEDRYRSVFQRMGQGYCELILLRDANGRVVDQHYLAFNPAFERIFGIPVADAVGRTASEVFPELEPWWNEAFDRITRQGQFQRIEHQFAALGLWFEVFVYPHGGDRLTVTYQDVTDRRRAEDALRDSKERQAFLLRLSDALRAEPNVELIADRGLGLLCEHLRLDRCYIGIYRVADDRADLPHQVGNDRVPPLPDSIRLSDFPNALQVAVEGTLVIDDFHTASGLSDVDRRSMGGLGLRALVAATLRKGNHDPLWTTVAVSSQPRRWTTGEISVVEETAERIWAAMEQAHAEADLRESEERFRGLVEGFVQFSWEASGDGLIVVDSPGWRTHTGQSLEAWLGRGWVDALHPEDQAETEQTWSEAVIAKRSVDHEYRLWHAPSASWRWSNVRAVPITNLDGSIRKWSGVNIDVTDHHRLLTRQEVLVNELQHRARNLLAVVAAIANRTVRQGGSVAAFEERLQALSRAQGLLSQAGSDKVEVGALVRAEIAAHADNSSERAAISGPEVHLTARQVQNFALALHELATNAVKYGALRGAAGHLRVTWEVVIDRRKRRRLALDWVESDVPIEPSQVMRRGYGTELIQEALAYALEADIDYEIGADGVRCRIEMPVS